MQYKFSFERNSENSPKIIVKSGNTFDGLTIFGDLVENAVLNKEKKAITDFRGLFGFDNKEEWIDYYQIICDLRTRIEQGELSSLDEFERLRPYYNLTFNYTFVVKNENGSIYPIRFGFSEVKPPFLQKTEMEHYCIYECFSMRDGVFSILHYLFLNNYKLRKCEHCGKYFATKTLKTKYCNRFSPYKGYESMSCSIAVDHILKKIKKRKGNVLKNMDRFYPEARPEFLHEYNIVFEKEKSVENLKQLETLTSKDYVRKHWYKEIYK